MEERKKRRGDRRDAYWVRDLDGLHTIMPHLMDKRTDAEVYVNMPFDVTETLRYIEGKTSMRRNTGQRCSTAFSWLLPKPCISVRI